MIDDDGILRLANAIIMQAVNDYKDGRLPQNEWERFVRSQYFTLLSRNCVSSDAVLEEVKSNGTVQKFI